MECHRDQDASYFAVLLKACGKRKNLSQGKCVHSQISSSHLSQNRFLANLLVEMYGKCGDIREARRVFDSIQHPNSYSWNIMIAAYTLNGHLRDARTCFTKMPEPGIIAHMTMLTAYVDKGLVDETKRLFDSMPERNLVSWNALFSAYAHNGYISKAREIFDRMPQRCVVTWTVMFAAYSRDGNLCEARNIFDQMPVKDSVAWNVMLSAYTMAGNLDAARSLFDSMPQRDVVSWTEIVSAYAQSAQLDQARSLFEAMPIRDLVSWTVMIAAYAQNGDFERGIRLFREMDLCGVQSNQVGFISVLDVCAGAAALTEGKILHEEATASGFATDLGVASALIHMYGKCGRIEDARLVFHSIPVADRDVVLWNSMMTVLAQSLESRQQAIELFEEMGLEGVAPDRVTFVNVLTACSRMGRIEDGWIHFASIRWDYSLEPSRDHYNCAADLLGRAGKLDDAEQLLRSMPHRSDSATWLALLSACKIHSDPQRGMRAATEISKIEPENPSSYVLMSNIYSNV